MDIIKQLVTSYNKQKINFILMGGGGGLADIIKYPGSSKIVNEIYIPYNSEDFLSRSNIKTNKIVSNETNKEIISKFRTNNYLTIVVNASLTTNRIRKGENEAFVSVDIPGKMVLHKHLTFSKFTKEELYNAYLNKRLMEDREITNIVLETIRSYNESN